MTFTTSPPFWQVVAGPPAVPDIDWPIYLHFDGSNGATVTQSHGSWDYEADLFNSATLSTTSPRIGSACVDMPNGTLGTRLSSHRSAQFALASNEWLILSFWLWFYDATTTANPVLFRWEHHNEGGGTIDYLFLQLTASPPGSPGTRLQVESSLAGGFPLVGNVTSGEFAWQHWEVAFGPTQAMLFRDGVLLATSGSYTRGAVHPDRVKIDLLHQLGEGIKVDDLVLGVGRVPWHSSGFTPEAFPYSGGTPPAFPAQATGQTVLWRFNAASPLFNNEGLIGNADWVTVGAGQFTYETSTKKFGAGSLAMNAGAALAYRRLDGWGCFPRVGQSYSVRFWLAAFGPGGSSGECDLLVWRLTRFAAQEGVALRIGVGMFADVPHVRMRAPGAAGWTSYYPIAQFDFTHVEVCLDVGAGMVRLFVGGVMCEELSHSTLRCHGSDCYVQLNAPDYRQSGISDFVVDDFELRLGQCLHTVDFTPPGELTVG